MNEKFCRDCEHFKEAFIKGGEGWCWRDNTKRFKDDFCKFARGDIKCIDAIESAVCGLYGKEALNTGTAIKYLWQWKWKNGAEDLKKSIWYIERLLKEVGKDE